MNDPVIIAESVFKSYPSGDRRLEVLRGASLQVLAGESISIRGESGSGKSTLLHLLAGLDAPDSGQLLWDGSPDTGASRRATFLGMVFQSFYLLPEIDALSNVLLPRRILGRPDQAARDRARELLKRVGLSDREKHLPSQLSGGEKQRVAIARAVMNAPRLLLADEPTGNLDERSAEGVIDLLLGLCKDTGTAVVIVTHNATHAARTDRQRVLHEGLLH